MDKDTVEENVIDIDILDTIGDGDVIVIPDNESRDDPRYAGQPISVSDPNPLGTGNILKQVFSLIAQIRSKEYWNLDEKEIKSLNKTCPKILPQTVVKHSGLIGCVLSVLGIIIKRLKLERHDSFSCEKDIPYDNDEKPEEMKSLTGGRND